MLNRLHDLLRLRTSPAIFFGAAAIIALFVIATITFTEAMDTVFSAASDWLYTNLGWFYIFGVTLFLVFLLYLVASRYGRVKLGPDDEPPEHSGMAWFAMLFAAGIGSILMFWGVAEPVSHFGDPPRGTSLGIEPGTPEAAADAMNFTLYHFTLHHWAIFTLPALCFAYFIHKRNLPPRISSIFQPIMGEKIHGPIGKLIDIVAIIGTVFGLAVSVGLGALQINAGINRLFGIPESAMWQLIIIGVVGGVAMISVGLGLDRGIKRLSNLNILLAVGLLIFVLVSGSTLFVVQGVFESTGRYLMNLPELAFWNDTYADTGWQNSWTVFYWAWTISWAPYVGLFFARISRGRTIRQFIGGVMAGPAVFTLLWFSIFGLSAFNIEFLGDSGIVETVVEEEDIPGALFAFLEHFPATMLVSIIALVLVTIFFITSVDSAALVVDTMANGHEDYNPLGQRLFWALSIAAVTATLLVFSGEGGIGALEQVVVLIGLPFFVFGFFQVYALHRALREDTSDMPLERTRRWKKVLPPEEIARRETDDDDDYDYEDEEAVVEPEAEEEAPVMRDPYAAQRVIGPKGTLAARTGTPHRRRPGLIQPTRQLNHKQRRRNGDE
ncbi:BCCT family transporter [Enteractinococcus fodinae]|uniref:Choline/carnitine/betaine transport n=1 Tax=Enteractinococcus fodinae TaxID=684663 RepID=A0ABU2B218_9MICC|nr:BCCT family transporter [Enteractinococcus fodinae]MDR7347631.1 choline/carnitine/betaine transport [Enteractinococcus fodinae]